MSKPRARMIDGKLVVIEPELMPPAPAAPAPPDRLPKAAPPAAPDAPPPRPMRSRGRHKPRAAPSQDTGEVLTTRRTRHGKRDDRWGPRGEPPTPDEFEHDLQVLADNSIVKLAEIYKLSRTHMYRVAHQLFPKRVFRNTPEIRYVVEDAGIDLANSHKKYSIREATQPEDAAVLVVWTGTEAVCQVCPNGSPVQTGKQFSSSCRHAMTVRRRVLDQRVSKPRYHPCDKCPWVKRGQPDLTPAIKQASVDGQWFCCHINMGTCIGAANYGNFHRQRSKSNASLVVDPSEGSEAQRPDAPGV